MTWHPSWDPYLAPETREPYFSELRVRVLGDRASGPVYPPRGQTFAALQVPLDRVRAVVLGQDPYHGPGQACGLAFSVPPGAPVPPSLRRVMREVQNNLAPMPDPAEYTEYARQRTAAMAARGKLWDGKSGDLAPWVHQGVLLLNAVLTVRAGQPGSHRGAGWERFTRAALRVVADQRRPIVWMLWGADARRAGAEALDLRRPIECGEHEMRVGHPLSYSDEHESAHLILAAGHPSPLARGFLGCDHFRRCNEWLRGRGAEPIDWSLPGAAP